MIEDIIEALNKYRESKSLNGYYVLQRYIEPCSTFKIYKIYHMILFLITSSDKTEVFKIEHQDRASDEIKFTKDAIEKFMIQLYKYIENGI